MGPGDGSPHFSISTELSPRNVAEADDHDDLDASAPRNSFCRNPLEKSPAESSSETHERISPRPRFDDASQIAASEDLRGRVR